MPDALKGVRLMSLDLGLLQAGAGVKGEFENRLKGVIDAVKSSPKPIVLFIDEAHTLIGAGGQAGQNDAANLLKPALARGELRCIAATTWVEYKKYFEKDAALTRRFQVVKVDEPTEPLAAAMLRGSSRRSRSITGPHSRRGGGEAVKLVRALHPVAAIARQGRFASRHGLRPRADEPGRPCRRQSRIARAGSR